MGLRRYLSILAAALIVAIILVVWFLPSSDDFRLDNPFWNGISHTKSAYKVQPLDSLADLPSSAYNKTLLLVPYLSSTTSELDHLNRFISRGGRLIMADDYGHGNEILSYLGLEVRFTGDTLLDPLVNYKNKQLPRIIRFQPDHPLTANTDNLVFNHATSLLNVSDNYVLASSSPFSFLDTNGDGTRQENEAAGPQPVISRHELGEGEIILISDPSIFINSMNDIEDNEQLIQNIAATTSVLYVDQSYLTSSNLYRSRSWLQQVRVTLSSPIWTAVLVLVAIMVVLIPIWYKRDEPLTEN